MNEGRILYARKGRQCFIKLIGEVRHTVSPGFDALIDKMFLGDEADTFIIDLNETVYIDSTNLGLLAKIARRLMDKSGARPIIVSGQQDVNTVLKSMGFDEVFVLIEECRADNTGCGEVPAVSVDKQEKSRLVLDAHKALMEMNEKCQDLFCDVVKMFEEEAAAQEQRS